VEWARISHRRNGGAACVSAWCFYRIPRMRLINGSIGTFVTTGPNTRNDAAINISKTVASRHDQRAICAAPEASGRPCPIHDPARSAAQIARSSRTHVNCAAVVVGFRPRLGPRRCATAPSTPMTLFLRLRSTSRVPASDRSWFRPSR
jgi:hypothetical protein